MIVGFRPGAGFLHRAHPFTPLAITVSVALLAFVLPGTGGPLLLLLAVSLLAVAAGVGGVLAPALVLAIPFWLFLIILHGLLDATPDRAVLIGARITAMLVTFTTAVAVVHPARLVDALLERGLPFSVAYLFAATLQAVPRLRERAREILDAQRCRGLRVRGSLLNRATAVVPLAVPLVLGALTEVDERAMALEARGVGAATSRTPLAPPADHPVERWVRWALLALPAVVLVVRFVG